MSTISINNQNSGFEQMLNPEFRRVVRSFKRALPYVATAFLFIVYGVSAWASGSLLAKVMGTQVATGAILGYAIAMATQVGRMVLVFYPLLNPTRPSMGYTGEVTGVLMGVVAIAEIWSSNMANKLHPAIAVSLTILMAIGVLAELYLLKEIKYYVKMELMGNEQYISKLKKFYVQEKKFDQLINDLEQGIFPDEDFETPTPRMDSNRRVNLPGKVDLKNSVDKFNQSAPLPLEGNDQSPLSRVRLNGLPKEDHLELQPLEEQGS